MSEDTDSGGKQFTPVAADSLAHLAILRVDMSSFFQKTVVHSNRRQRVFLKCQLGHSIQRPEEIDGRRSTAGEVTSDFRQFFVELISWKIPRIARSDYHPIRGGDANRWSPADTQHLDRFPDAFRRPAFNFAKLSRQQCLVDHPQAASGVTFPVKSLVFHVLKVGSN